MQTFLLGLRTAVYALLGVAAILGLIFALMKLVGSLTAQKHPAESENQPTAPDDKDTSEPML